MEICVWEQLRISTTGTIGNAIKQRCYVQLYLGHMYIREYDFVERTYCDCVTIIGLIRDESNVWFWEFEKYTMEEIGHGEIENDRTI